jgi:hypothetical protein
MNETPDPLEAELAAFRPMDVSPELRRRIATRLSRSTAGPKRRLWTIALVAGLAAACLVALFLGRGGHRGVDRRPAIVGPPLVTSGRTEDMLPSLRAYRQALDRSPEDLEALLDRHAARSHGLASRLVRIRAFNQPDSERQAMTGEL